MIGWPVEHSRSPLIHRHWLQRHDIAGSYERAPVTPEDLERFVRSMPVSGTVGGNVTVPHKSSVAALCDRLSPEAARTGSVNTVWFEDGHLCGDTTDGHGFLAALDEEAPGWDRERTAVVLGTGGAARAIVPALAGRGCSVVVAGRSAGRAEDFAASFGCRAVDLAAVEPWLADACLLVNTTPAGMKGQAPLALDLAALPDDAVVDDIVYVPEETPLLRQARARRLRTVGGLGMLLHQAAPGFARWFGVRPAVTPALRALVAADIAAAP